MSVRRSSAVVGGGVGSAVYWWPVVLLRRLRRRRRPWRRASTSSWGCDGYEHLAVDISDVFHSTGVTVSAPEKVVAGVDLHVPGATECDVSADRWPCGSQCR